MLCEFTPSARRQCREVEFGIERLSNALGRRRNDVWKEIQQSLHHRSFRPGVETDLPAQMLMRIHTGQEGGDEVGTRQRGNLDAGMLTDQPGDCRRQIGRNAARVQSGDVADDDAALGLRNNVPLLFGSYRASGQSRLSITGLDSRKSSRTGPRQAVHSTQVAVSGKTCRRASGIPSPHSVHRP